MPSVTDRSADYDDDAAAGGSRLQQLLAIHTAIMSNDARQLREACKRGLRAINDRFTDEIEPQHAGMTPLALAAALNRVQLVRVLLDSRANPNTTFAALHTTALMTSSFHGHVEVVRLLIERGADAAAADLQGSTALGYCFGGSRSVEVVEMLINAGVDVNKKNMLGMNALLLVAGYGNDQLIQLVLRAGADPSSVNDFGHSALHLAVVGKRSQIGSIVTSTPLYGLNRRNIGDVMRDWANSRRDLLPQQQPQLGEQLQELAVLMEGVGDKLVGEVDDLTSDDQEAVRKRLDAVNRYRQDQLSATSSGSRSSVMDTFLSCGGKRGKQQPRAAAAAAPRQQQQLVTSGSPEEDRSVAELCERFARIIRLLLDSGCSVQLTEHTFGMSALDMAVLLGDVESVVLLAHAGADCRHLLTLFSLSDLYAHIALAPDKKSVKQLLHNDKHVNVNAAFTNFNVAEKSAKDVEQETADGCRRGDEGLTPLAVAARAQDNRTVEIIKMLLKNGADINLIGPGGRSPLGEAARGGNVRMVEFLVMHGANIEQENSGWLNATPLIMAVVSKQTAVVEYLLSAGSKLDAHMSDYRTALDKAMQAGDMPMIDTLLEHCDLSKNFHSSNSLSYKVALEYKRPDRNIQNILAQISDNVRAISEREAERARQAELQAARQQEAMRLQGIEAMRQQETPSVDLQDFDEPPPSARRSTKSSKNKTANQSETRNSIKNKNKNKTADQPESRSGSRNKTNDQSEQRASNSRKKNSNQSEQLIEAADTRESRRKKGASQSRSSVEPEPVDDSEHSEESEIDIPEPPPAAAVKQSKKTTAAVQQKSTATGKVKQQQQQQQQQLAAAEVKVSNSSKTAAPKPVQQRAAAPDSETESETEEETETEEESEEDIREQQIVTKATVQQGAVKSSNNKNSTVVTSSNKTTVTKTVVTTTSAHIATAQRAQVVQAESSSGEETEDSEDEEEDDEEEDEEEEEEIEDVNRNIGKVKVSGHKQKHTAASAETDI